MKNFFRKYGSWMAALALVVTSINANSTCIFLMHQPEIPESAKKLRKF